MTTLASARRRGDCSRCRIALNDSRWYYLSAKERTVCEECYKKGVVFAYCAERIERPHHIAVAIQQIEAHPGFKEFETVTKMRYIEYALRTERERTRVEQRDENRFIRAVWRSLYNSS